MKGEKGSILVLTVMAVLILSIMVTGLLNVGTTELYTTQNYHLNKSAYYAAVQGVEEMRTAIYNAPDPESVTGIIQLPPSEAYSGSVSELTYYVLGSLKDLEDIINGDSSEGTPIDMFKGFKPPPLPGISLGSGISIEPVVWKVNVTANVKRGNKNSYSEILSGVYSVVNVSY